MRGVTNGICHDKRKAAGTQENYGEKHMRQFQEDLLSWYVKEGRRFPWRKKRLSCYQRIVSEILLQRTKAETVAKFYPFFMERFSCWKQLAAASKEELENVLKPIGLWHRRAVVLEKLSYEMKKRNGQFPRGRDNIESLPGVGQYIANAIELFCHGKPRPLLDANMARVLERVFGPRKLADIRYDNYLQKLAHEVVTCESPCLLNWAILDIAALVCKIKKPICYNCPLESTCRETAHLMP